MAVTAGTTYYIRLSLPGCCPGTFTLNVTVPTPPANDLIENAAPITTLPFTATQNSTDGTLSPTDPPSSCGFVSQYTLWYSYTAPADGLIKIRTSSTNPFATPRVTVYEGSPGSLTEVSCNQIVRVTAGTSYYLMLTVPGCCFGTFTLDVTVPTPPANDLIENATPINALPFTTTQDSADATVSPTDPPSLCNSSPTYTLWYSYTAPADGLLKIGPSSNAVTLYRGPLGSLTEVGCGGQDGQFLPVTAGTSYYLMVSNSCCFGPFTLDVSIPNPPPNDLIDNATPIVELPFTVTQASVDATWSPTDPSSTCIGGAVPTVWYSFAATTDGLIQARTTGGFSTYVTVYRGQPGSLSQVACTFGGQPLPVPVTKGATYYLSVVALLHDTFTLNVTGLVNMSLPGDITLEAMGPLGATVNYVATASLPDGSPAPIDCSPPTGATVPLGDTTITCTASDNDGHTLTRGFVVHVVDTVSPTLTVPASITTNATGPGGTSVSYAVSATDMADPNPTVACDPPSESLFTVGDTTVRCIATDLAGNGSDPASFVVHVKGAPEQIRDLREAVAALPGAASLRQSLQVKLRDAENALSAGKQASACGSLNDFIGAVNARSGKSIAAATAQSLITDATRIKTVIECRR